MVSHEPQNRYQNAMKALEVLSSETLPPTVVIPVSKLQNQWWKLLILGCTLRVGIGVWSWSKESVGDYRELKNYLQEGDWELANQETLKVMVQVAGSEEKFAVMEFPCEDLKYIDRLWVEYSNGNFGFSVQQQVYHETGNTIGEYNVNAYGRFGDRLGWQKKQVWLSAAELTFSDSAPQGHLPSGRILVDNMWFGEFFARRQVCKL